MKLMTIALAVIVLASSRAIGQVPQSNLFNVSGNGAVQGSLVSISEQNGPDGWSVVIEVRPFIGTATTEIQLSPKQPSLRIRELVVKPLFRTQSGGAPLDPGSISRVIELRIVDNNPSLGSIAHVDRVVIPNESQFIPANGATRHLSGRVGVIQVAGTVGDGQSPIGISEQSRNRRT